MRKRRSPIGCLFWIAIILLAVVIFVFNRGRFETALKSMGLENLVTKSLPKRPNPSAPSKPATPPLVVRPSGSPSPGGAPSAGGGGQSGAGTSTASQSGPGQAVGPSRERQPHSVRGAAPTSNGAPTGEQAHRYLVYYIRVSNDGTPQLHSVRRAIPDNDTPLTDTLRSLLTGLPAADAKSGLVSLIPSGTELLGVSLRNGTAYLDFNDRFRFNALGAEGIRAELQQVVFTATQFPTVQRVQILIAGQVHHYLGPEGMAIDRPLSRATFNEG